MVYFLNDILMEKDVELEGEGQDEERVPRQELKKGLQHPRRKI